MLMLIQDSELVRLLTLGDILRELVDAFDFLELEWLDALQDISSIREDAKPFLNDFVIQWGAVLTDYRDAKLRVREFANVTL